ncbi:MAG: cyclic peptide export ABC transporter [Pseudomonadota bacterium]
MIFSESKQSLRMTIILSIVSSLSSIGLIFIINTAAEHAADQETKVSLFYFALFVVVFLLYFFAKRISFVKSMAIVEGIVKNLRIRISDKVRYANLESMEKLGLAQIQTRLSSDTLTVSNASYIMIAAVQGVLMFFFGMLYILYLSKVAFFLTLSCVIGGILVYSYYNDTVVEQIDKSIKHDDTFFKSLMNIIEGFNELKINGKKSDAVIEHHSIIAQDNEKIRNLTNKVFANSSILIQFFAYFLLGCIVFIVPQFSDQHSEVVTKIVAVLIFMMSPIDMITGAVPTYSRANRSAFFLEQLEHEIDKMADYSPYHSKFDFKTFDKIHLKDITFHYKGELGEPLFGIGPMDFEINRGEMVFIRGGNGSGKSTFVKIFTHLYNSDSGSIKVDNTTVAKHNIKNYQNMFAMILTDFHLFDRLYGVDNIDLEHLQALLDMMDLSSKVDYENGHFSNINLSTGQRKRLALVMALMEDKPIYLLDEWAADQDPQFRKYFYMSILPELKAQGKTVLAVSHDDHYFHVADRVCNMSQGVFEDSPS